MPDEKGLFNLAKNGLPMAAMQTPATQGCGYR